MLKPSISRVLAKSFLAGEPTVKQLTTRASIALGRNWRWLKPLAQRYVAAFSNCPRPRFRDVAEFLKSDSDLDEISYKYRRELAVKRWLPEPQRMQPVAAAASWNLPAIESLGFLGNWLNLDAADVDWYADLKSLIRKRDCPKLSHYHYRILAKPSGNIRLIESPKSRLKYLQRQILAQILDKVPPHAAAHGFIKGRSIRTFIAPHIGKHVILRMDLRDFFPSVTGARIQTIFRTFGYPEPVADLLGGICTNSVPGTAWTQAAQQLDPQVLWEVRSLYARPHLPQGAPTSPALANLCAYRIDCRLTGLAQASGAEYSRYADDLAFSGGEHFDKQINRFSLRAAAIILEEGFTVNQRKTRIMRQGVRQRLGGLVANQHINIDRTTFDTLKATLTNCVRHGPASQNRDAHPHFRAHLDGRIQFIESINPAKGKRLRTLFDEIEWN